MGRKWGGRRKKGKENIEEGKIRRKGSAIGNGSLIKGGREK